MRGGMPGGVPNGMRGGMPGGTPRTAPGVPSGFGKQNTPQAKPNPGTPGVRGGQPAATRPVISQKGVIGSRQAQAAARGGASAPSQAQTPGVRAARVRSGGDQLNRGIIRGAKQGVAPAKPAGDVNYGQRPARGGVLKTGDDDGIESTYEEEVFTVDQQVVPGVIRGHKTPKSSGNGRGGRAAFDDDDDW